MTAEIRVELHGDGARLGEVPVADVVRLLDGTVRAFARAAEVLSGRRPGQVGRRGVPVEEATRFRLKALESGSIAVRLVIPSDHDAAGLPLDDANLSELAIQETLDTLDDVTRDPYISEGLAEFADELGIGSRYDEIRFVRMNHNTSPRVAHLNSTACRRLRRLANTTPATIPSAITGTLVEADFERRTARLRTSDKRAIKVTFKSEHADDIHTALRSKAEFDGLITYDPTTNEANAVELRSVARTEQLSIERLDKEFWRAVSIEELSAEQNVDAVTDVEIFHDSSATDEEIDAFFRALDL